MSRTRTKKELTRRIRMTDSAGNEYMVDEYTEYTSAMTLSEGWTPWAPGMRSFFTGGTPVNVTEDGQYTLAYPRKLLRPAPD